MVTHDPKEALLLANEIYVLSAKPTVIKSYHRVSLPQDQRKPDALPLLQLEQEITTALIRD